jgi:PKD repeat protein
MKKIFTLLLSLMTLSAWSQCIKNFPYRENFEKFRNTQTSASCDATIKGDTANGWAQDPSDNGEWRADTAGTVSIGTGPGATDSTSGNGTGKDYNPGTINGVYMYTEGSSATSCASAVINLLSPCFDFSATGKYYKLTFAYHMFGAGMGSLFIDVYDNGVWTNAVWTRGGNQGESWIVADVPLGKFNSSNVQIRIRSIMGPNFATDMAIDDISIFEYNPPVYDAELLTAQRFVNQYVFFTPRQGKPSTLASNVKNNGVKDITGVKVIATCGNHSDTLVLDTIKAFSAKGGNFGRTFSPKDTSNQRRIYFSVLINESDTIQNHTRDIGSGLTDSTIARDNGFNTGGIGFNGGTGEIGQMFHLQAKDTLTSVSFYHAGPTAGDSVRVKLYTFSSNAPGTLITSTSSLALRTGGSWYTLRFPCEQLLDTGTYFVAVEQRNTNNMSLGYTTAFYTPQTVFFNGGAGWTDAATSNFFVALLVRINTGKINFPKVTLTAPKDTICEKETLLVRAGGASTYEWLPPSSVSNPNAFQNNVSPSSSTAYTVRGTNACRLSAMASLSVNVKQAPSGTITPDTTICYGKSITLAAKGGSSYTWINGPSNTNYTVSPTFSTIYRVKFDSTNGCSQTLNVNVAVDHPSISKNADTTLCEGSNLSLIASGLTSYKWLSGPASPQWDVTAIQTRSFIITGKNARGCDAVDSVRIIVIPSPKTTKSADTSICFGNRVTLTAGGGTSFEWLGGPSSASWNFLPFNSEYKYVTITGSNGCSKTDSVYVNVASFPTVTLGNDTTICEGKSAVLSASASESVNYSWSHGPTTQQVTVSPKIKTVYKVRGTNSTGCFNEDSLTINVNPLPTSSFTHVQNGKNVTLNSTSKDHQYLNWTLGDGNTATANGFVHTYSSDGTYKIRLIATNNCGTDTSEIEIIVNTAGLHDAVSYGYKFYPQPAYEMLNIEFPENVSSTTRIEMIDAKGKTVMSFPVIEQTGNHSTISLKDLTAGIYTIKILNGEDAYYYRMLKQ